MVLQKRLDYGFNGYQAPVVPRASRSARGKSLFKKKCEDSRIHAFEILASVAGNLLQEGESSGLSNSVCGNDQNDVKDTVKWEAKDVGQLVKAEASENETSIEKTFVHTPGSQVYHPSCTLNPLSCSQDNFSLKGNTASDHSEKINIAEKLSSVSDKTSSGSAFSKAGGESPRAWKLFAGQPEDGIEIKPEADLLNTRSTENISHTINESSGDAMELDVDARAHSYSESNINNTSFFKDCIAPGSFPGHCKNIKVARRDDDENSLGCSQLGMGKSHRSVPFAGDRRVRASSRDWRHAQNLKSEDHFRNDWKMKPVYNNRGSYFSHYRSQKMFPFKKRKFFDLSPLSSSDREFLCEDINNSSNKQANYDDFGPVTGAASSAAQQARADTRECNMKLSIKSFKVPELFIEIPATATVASLKRTVMEAVNTILGDGIHVGILLQGKKVRDDSKTLLQTGISEDDKHGSLGFILEPNRTRITSSSCTQSHHLASGNAPGELTRHTASLMMQPGTSSGSPIPKDLSLGTRLGSDLTVAPSCADTSTVNTASDSRAMVTMPTIGMEALAVVPYNRKPGHPEFGQRRMRRPFSVSEVEALVQAVEKLGTGRWRDVKLRAFNNANHRTYVDLKDKWKTLVHTARISPQQRRGETVPQQLLDRVLAAHAYWSQHQARQQVKTVV